MTRYKLRTLLNCFTQWQIKAEDPEELVTKVPVIDFHVCDNERPMFSVGNVSEEVDLMEWINERYIENNLDFYIAMNKYQRLEKQLTD